MPYRREASPKYGVVASTEFVSGPPAALYTDEDGEVFETVKEEEVVHKKRKATTTTRNIERRTQRDLLLEDGKVVGDSGPTVTEDVTEDTVVKETFADENLRPEGQSEEGTLALPPGEGWVAVPGALVTTEKLENIITSHQEKETTRETEQEAHYGDVTNKEVEYHRGNVSGLAAAAEARKKARTGKEVALSEPRLVRETNRNWGIVDTEDIKENSRIKDGHVTTETTRTTQQEQFDHASAPDSGSSISDGSVHEEGRRAQHRIVHTKDEDILEYYAVPKGGTLAQGVKLGEGMHVVNEDVQEDKEGDALEDVGSKFLRYRTAAAAAAASPTPREDALTKKPLDYVKEEKQRQHETTRWLEHHFGSDSGESHEGEKSGNLIKITMSPHPASPPPTPPQGPLRRWGNLTTSTPKTSKIPPPPPKSSIHSGPPPAPMPHQINEARARLRSTGRTLDEIDSQRDMYNAGRVHKNSYSFSQNSEERFTPPMSPISPNSYSKSSYSNSRYQRNDRERTRRSYEPDAEFNKDLDDSELDKRYSKYGVKSTGYRYESDIDRDGRVVNYRTEERDDQYPKNKPNVGRSRSFHTSNVEHRDEYDSPTWKRRSRSPEPPGRQPRDRPQSAAQFSTLQNPKKSDKFLRFFGIGTAKNQDNPDGTISKRSKNKKSGEKLQNIFRKNFDRSPDHNKENKKNSSYKNQGSTKFSAKMAGKYSDSDEAPVPPPRTKRRQPRPQTTYFFGQDSDDNTKPSRQRPHSIYANISYDRKDENNKYSRSNGYSEYKNNSYRNEEDSRQISNNRRYNESMNRKNNYYSNGTEYRSSKIRDNSNERCDSGYGDPHDSYNKYNDSGRNKDYSGRKSANSRRYEEKSYRKYGDEPKRNQRKSSRDDRNYRKSSPYGERKYKTTTNVTPVYVMETKQSPKKYRSMDILNSSPERNSSTWTQTLGSPKKSQKKFSDEYASVTLPRKVRHVTSFTTPSKTYVYGTEEQPNNRTKSSQLTSGSLLNVNSGYDSKPSYRNGLSNTNVSRSHSVNIRPVGSVSNLRSPNLIASIARTNSTRQLNAQSNEDLLSRDLYERSGDYNHQSRQYTTSSNNVTTDDKKTRFMEGLLNTAPELFHFMHGEGQDEVDKNKPEPTTRKTFESSSPTPLNAPKVFTFGRKDETLKKSEQPKVNYSTNSMGRNSSGYDSGSYTNSVRRIGPLDSNGRRQSAFNMKTEGSSLLYSPSLRERTLQRKKERQQRIEEAEFVGKRANLLREDSPVRFEVNSR